MKAFYQKNKFVQDRKRFEIFSAIKKSTECHEESYISLKSLLYENLIIDDELAIKNILKIICLSLFNLTKVKYLYSLETYNLSFKAALSEALSKKDKLIFLKSFTRRMLRAFLFNFLLLLNNSVVIHCSHGRKEFMNYKKQRVIPNLPIKYSKITQQKPIKKNYVYLSGAINCHESMKQLITFCRTNDLLILYSGDSSSFDDEVILKTGRIEPDKVYFFIKNALACACFYMNNSVNQRFSASSKLLEYAYFGKKIIVNENPGVNEIANRLSIDLIKLDNMSIKELLTNKNRIIRIPDYVTYLLRENV